MKFQPKITKVDVTISYFAKYTPPEQKNVISCEGNVTYEGQPCNGMPVTMKLTKPGGTVIGVGHVYSDGTGYWKGAFIPSDLYRGSAEIIVSAGMTKEQIGQDKIEIII